MKIPRIQFRSRPSAQFVLAGLVLVLVAGCSRIDETALRARLDRWFSISETIAFHSSVDCAAAAFRLVDMEVKSPIPLLRAVEEVPGVLVRQGAMVLHDPEQAPDVALMALANSDRPLGMGMRRIALEARSCMNETTESAFRYALDNPQSMLAYDLENQTLMLLDPRTGLIIVAMGTG